MFILMVLVCLCVRVLLLLLEILLSSSSRTSIRRFCVFGRFGSMRKERILQEFRYEFYWVLANISLFSIDNKRLQMSIQRIQALFGRIC